MKNFFALLLSLVSLVGFVDGKPAEQLEEVVAFDGIDSSGYSVGKEMQELGPVAIDPSGTYGYVIAPGANGILQFEVHSEPIRFHSLIALPYRPCCITFDPTGETGYVATSGSSFPKIYPFCSQDGHVSPPITLQSAAANGKNISLAMTPDGSMLVAADGSNSLFFVDVATHQVTVQTVDENIFNAVEHIPMRIPPTADDATITQKCTNISCKSLKTGTIPTFGPLSPTVTSLSPTQGPPAGGTLVVIQGTNFTGATAVTFGGTSATSFAVNSANMISAIAPAGTPGAIVYVIVTTPSGSSSPTASSQYTYMPLPVVTAVTPSTGPDYGGTLVTIAGTGFTGASAVNFGSSSATRFIVVSDVQIKAVAPAGAPGSTVAVTVTTASGTSLISSNSVYSYVLSPSPPRNLKGQVINDQFASQTDVVHKLTWDPSLDLLLVARYNIFRNGTLIGTVKAPLFQDIDELLRRSRFVGPVSSVPLLQFEDHNRVPGVPDTYEVTAVNFDGVQSVPATVVVP